MHPSNASPMHHPQQQRKNGGTSHQPSAVAASSFFNSTPTPPITTSTKPISNNFRRVQSQGSSHFAQQSLASVSTMTNRTMTPGPSSAAGARFQGHGSVPATIQVRNRNVPVSTATANNSTAIHNGQNSNVRGDAEKRTNANQFFTQSQQQPAPVQQLQPVLVHGTLNGNQSVGSTIGAGVGAKVRAGEESKNDGSVVYPEYESPALSTAVSLFSKTASALFQSTSAAIDVAGGVGNKVEAMRNDFVTMAAPMNIDRNNPGVHTTATTTATGTTFSTNATNTFFGQKNPTRNALGIAGASPVPASAPAPAPAPFHAAKPVPTSVALPIPSSGPTSDFFKSTPIRAASPIPPPAITTTGSFFQENAKAASVFSQPSPARSAAEMFGQSAVSVRSASPAPVMEPHTPQINNDGAPGYTPLNASVLFGNKPPDSVRAPSPIPVRAPSPTVASPFAPLPSKAAARVFDVPHNPDNSVGVKLMQTAPVPPSLNLIEEKVVLAKTRKDPMYSIQDVDIAHKSKQDKPSSYQSVGASFEREHLPRPNSPPEPFSQLDPVKICNPDPSSDVPKQSTPARSIEPIADQITSDKFQKPPLMTNGAQTTPARVSDEKEMEHKIVSTPSSTTSLTTQKKSTPIQAKPLPRFNKPRLPSPLPRRPRVCATPDRKALLLPVPVKKPLPLPQPKRKASFTASLLEKKDTFHPNSCEDGVSITSLGSASARSGNSASCGMFRMPPPIQISSSPNIVKRAKKLGDVTSPLKSPISTPAESCEDVNKNHVILLESTESEGVKNSSIDTDVTTHENDHTIPQKEVNIVSAMPEASITKNSEEAEGNNLDKTNASPYQSPPPLPVAPPPLPENWIELIAPDSGMKYYLNTITRTTTWDRPIPPDFRPPLPPAPEQTATSSPKGSASESTIARNIQVVSEAQEDLPNSVLEANVHPIKERTIHNSVAQEFMTPIISNATKNQISTLPKKSGPALTIPEITTEESVITTEDHADYVHIPSDKNEINDVVSEVLCSVSSEIIDDPKTSETKPETEGSWTQFIDQHTGAAYYYNKQQDITSWDKPKNCSPFDANANNQNLEAEQPSHFQQCEGEHNYLGDASHGNNLSENALNVEGCELVESISEKIENQETKFESIDAEMTQKVHEDISNAANHPEMSQEPISSAERSRVIEDLHSLPTDWVIMIDESSGEPYYLNQNLGITQWETPHNLLGADQVEEAGSYEEVSFTENEAPAGDSLSRAFDTGIDSQSDPMTVEETLAIQEDSFHGVQLESKVQVDTSSKSANLPIGWISMKDKSSAMTYYINEGEGITQWEKPEVSTNSTEEAFVVTETKALEEQKDSADVVINEQSNEELMVQPHETTNSQCLHTIAIVETENVTQLSPTSAHSVDSKLENTALTDGTEMATNEIITGEGYSVSLNQMPQISSDLTTGWIEMTDESSGRQYYYHRANNITQWTKPEALNLSFQELDVVSDNQINRIENPDIGVFSPDGEDTILNTAAAVASIDEKRESVDESLSDKRELIESGETKKEADTVDFEHSIQVGADENKLSSCEVVHAGQSLLPAGWVQVEDENSGQIYYYNEIENITQWEKPELVVFSESSVANIIHPQNSQHMDSASVTSPEVLLAVTTETESAGKISDNFNASPQHEITALPEGWVELTDQSSGSIYYYNELENITTWDIPEASGPTETSLSKLDKLTGDIPEASSTTETPFSEPDKTQEFDQPSEETLGILQAEDRNESTGSTDINNIDPPIIAEEAKSKSEIMTEATAVDLPPNWVEVIDESSGLPYFFNATENITQWDRPNEDEKLDNNDTSPTSVLHSEDEPREDTLEESGKTTNASTAKDGNRLPIGWIELIDEQSGQPYYFHETSNTTRWKKPEVTAEVNTLTKENDETNLDETSDKDREEASAKNLENHIDSIVSEGSKLQSGWIEMFDESSGQPYYFNESKNLTQWEKPLHPQNTLMVNPTIERIDKNDNGILDSQEDWVEVDAPSPHNVPDKPSETKKDFEESTNFNSLLPPGWTELVDSASGKHYYFHETEKKTQWDCPTITETKKLSEVRIEDRRRCRPAHAIASFGFGGRLCVMRPQLADSLAFHLGENSNPVQNLRKGPVKLFRLSSLLSDDNLPIMNSNSCRSPVPKPFVNCPDAEVLSYLKEKSSGCSTDNELLWNLVSIAARWKGRLRSADGISNPDGPEATVVNLLLRSEYSMPAQKLISLSVEDGSKTGGDICLEEAQKLLLRGKREEAVKCALSGGDHALALLIASLCGPVTYHTAARYYIQKTIKSGTPLHTAMALFANQIQTPEEADELTANFWKDRAESVGESWQYHLATVLSNQTRGWKNILTSLGDELIRTGYVDAAHFCYLVSGRPISHHSNNSSCLVLVGCDHKIKEHVALMTKEAWEAYLRTEALEWAKRKGNPNAVISTLQPFKLRYAILLADFGFEETAKLYVESIRKCTGLYPASPIQSKVAHAYPNEFVKSLDVFEDRLCVSLEVPNGNAPIVKQTSKLANVLSKIASKPKEDESFHEAMNTETSFFDDANEDANASFVSASSHITTLSHATKSGQHKPNNTTHISMPTMMSTVTEAPEDLPPKEKIKNTPHLDDKTLSTPNSSRRGNDLNPEVISKSTTPRVPLLYEENKAQALRSKNAKPSVGTPSHGVGEAPKSAPPFSSTPSTMTTPVERKPKNEAPSSGSSWSVRGWLTKKLHPDSTIADEGEKMEAYYDKELKRWIFPGDDPAEVAKPLAPPPTTPVTKENNAPVSTPKPTSNDPLAAMMAPPSRSRPTPVGPPKIPRSHNLSHSSSTKASMPPTDAPPQFVIFQPKTTGKGEEKK